MPLKCKTNFVGIRALSRICVSVCACNRISNSCKIFDMNINDTLSIDLNLSLFVILFIFTFSLNVKNLCVYVRGVT